MDEPPKLSRRTGAALPIVMDLLRTAHLARPDELGELALAHAAKMGLENPTLWLLDLQQEALVPFASMGPLDGGVLTMQGTLAGRACREGAAQHVAGDDGVVVWLPLIDAGERLGVLGGTVHKWTRAVAERLGLLAVATASLVASQQTFSDLVIRTRRSQAVSLAAELQWGLLPPLSFSTAGVSICGLLEPAYDIGGDSFDYAVNDAIVHFAIFDAVGHGLHAALVATVAIGAYRQARRSGNNLEQAYAAIDAAVKEEFGPGRAGNRVGFVTGVLAELDLDSGQICYILAGHPPPLVLRHHKVARHLDGPICVPFGLAGVGRSTAPSVERGRESLEPGDRVFLYSDGVIEARTTEGEQFGLDRLEEFLVREELAAGTAAETLRRLVRAIRDYQQRELQDDASLLLIEWNHSAASS